MSKASLAPVSWEAEEYIVRDHDAVWYIGLFIVAIGLGVIAVLYQSWTFLVLIILSIITILVSNLRPPRKIHYTLDNKGLKEGNRLHQYNEFRSFGILKDGNHFLAILIPKKRFGLRVRIYFPEGSGEAIVDNLGNRLPMEEAKPDILDRIVTFLRI